MKHLWILLLLVAAATAQVKVAPAVSAPGQRSATLTWQENTPSVTSFKVYRGLTPGGENYASPIATVAGTVLTYTDASVVSGQNYCYTVTAVLGVESPPSNEGCVLIPQQPSAPSLAPVVAN